MNNLDGEPLTCTLSKPRRTLLERSCAPVPRGGDGSDNSWGGSEQIWAEVWSWPDSTLSQLMFSVLSRYAIPCQSTSKQTGLPFFSFFLFTAKFCQSAPSISAWQSECVFVLFMYLFIWWTPGRRCCLTTGTVSLLRSRGDVWNASCQSEWSIHAVHTRKQIQSNIYIVLNKCCTVDQIYSNNQPQQLGRESQRRDCHCSLIHTLGLQKSGLQIFSSLVPVDSPQTGKVLLFLIFWVMCEVCWHLGTEELEPQETIPGPWLCKWVQCGLNHANLLHEVIISLILTFSALYYHHMLHSQSLFKPSVSEMGL